MSSQKITVELFPAGNGDAILISIDNTYILVDGGYTSTFRDHLKKRLIDIKNSGGQLSRFIVTHIDADHITGAISFLAENGLSNDPKIIGIDEVWFNSYRHMQFEEKLTGSLDTIPNIPISGGISSTETEDPEIKVSFKQGSTLGATLLKGGYAWNKSFHRGPVLAKDPIPIPIAKGVTITILGPVEKSLNDLAKKWFRDLRKRYKGIINEDDFFDDAFELLTEELRQEEEMESSPFDPEVLVSGLRDWVEGGSEWEDEDKSLTNGSSITFLLEAGEKKLLFLGDAIPGQVVKQLKKLHPESSFPLKVDIFKVAHHGAFANNSPDLLKMIRADYYLFSSDGKRHHHPHFDTMATMLKHHGADFSKTFVFNYTQGDRLIDVDLEEMKEKYNYKVLWPDKDELGHTQEGYVRLQII